MRRFAVCLAAALACSPQPSSPPSSRDVVPPPAAPAPRCGDLEAELIARTDRLRREHGYPGVVAAVVAGGELAVVVGRGVADRAGERPMRRDAVFQIGSVTKMLAGLVVADLARREVVDLDAPLSRYFEGDEIPPAAGAATLRQVATHTAGFPRYPDNLIRDDGDPILGYERGQLLEAIASVELDAPPGTAWSYSNFGYGVLAEVIERATGETFADLLVRRVLEPLGMRDTSVDLAPRLRDRLAVPYRDDDPMVATEPWQMGALAAAGNAFSTAEDLARLAVAEMAPERAPADLRASFETAQAIVWSFGDGARDNGYGLGRFVVASEKLGARVVWHGGDVDGYASALMAAPEEGVAVVILANAGIGAPIGDYLDWLMAAALRQCR